MKLNRRAFFKGVLASVVAAAVIPTLPKPAEAQLDLHSETARNLFGEGFTPKQRHQAKTYNFHHLYGGLNPQEFERLTHGTWTALNRDSGMRRNFNSQYIRELRAKRELDKQRHFMRNYGGNG